MNSINVASKTKTKELSDTIASSEEDVMLSCIGAGAINQAIKAIAILNNDDSRKFVCSPHFFSTIINNEEKSGIKLYVKEEEK